MNILHISVAGIVDKFYLPFLSNLKSELNINETIYIPYSDEDCSESEKQILIEYDKVGINVVALPIKNKIDRILYKSKIRKYTKNLIQHIDIKQFQMIHAHSLFSDGGVAYLLNQKYGIPYIVAVRTTDTNVFMRYFPHLKKFARKIIEHSDRVIFITPNIQEQIRGLLYQKDKFEILKEKECVIPNGINDFWVKNRLTGGKELSNNSVRLIQISRLNERKRVDVSIKAVKILYERDIDVSLDILGEGESKEKLIELAKNLNVEDRVFFQGYIREPEEIRKYLKQSDIFVMPSTGETFGLVYVEAMSQGLPIIGIRDTGVSGYFVKEKVGEFIDEPNEVEVANAVERIILNYSTMSANAVKNINSFNWHDISKRYGTIYEKRKVNG